MNTYLIIKYIPLHQKQRRIGGLQKASKPQRNTSTTKTITS